ncbi:hypothetical protein M513_11338 [Trichuris suis]|uniref:Uncharacterized protein n=1 Tax=Trichuris suis TaxID=68888 RepID=A0A085LS42_9BILA|nr:hypothetical protein M513_11338 [Trichuris suis]
MALPKILIRVHPRCSMKQWMSHQDLRLIPACLDADGCSSSSASVKLERLKKDVIANCLASRLFWTYSSLYALKMSSNPALNRLDRSRLGSCCSAIQ